MKFLDIKKSLKSFSSLLTPLALGVSLASCSSSNLPKYVELKGLRIITLIADSPEVDPSTTVSITPVISDITETSSLNYIAYGCIDPGVSEGATPSCENSSSKTLLSQGSITSSSNSEMAQNFTGSAPSFSVTVPASTVIFAQRSSVDQFNGVSYLVTYTLSNSKGESVSAIKRIIVSNKVAISKNANPQTVNILSQGLALASNAFPVNGTYSLQVEMSADSQQAFPYKLSDSDSETRTEQITTTWFITDGSIKYYRSSNQDVNEFTAPSSLPADRKSFLFSVSRDSRGGVSVKRICGGC